MVLLSDCTPPTEGIHHAENNIEVHVKDRSLGKGTLYITDSVLRWVSNNGQGFTLEYPSIGMHAVAKDFSDFPKENLLLMVKKKIIDELVPTEEDKENEDVEEDIGETGEPYIINEVDADDVLLEMRLIPDNKEMLDVMFRALSDCQALHPDTIEGSDDDDFIDENTIFNFGPGGDYGNGHLEEEPEVNGEHGEVMDMDQFEDAESER